MRTLILTMVMLVSFGPSSMLAQDQGRGTLNESQPPQAQDNPTGPANPRSKEENNERRVRERLGPGMDWDHRKPGRNLQISPHRESGDVNHERD